jgi:hypothetical protein
MPTNSAFFARFPNPCFVETGSYIGDGIHAALTAGFQRVHSIELSPRYHGVSTRRFAGDPRVTVHLGDSSSVLAALLPSIKTPITFWLDGHYSAGDTALGAKSCPLMEELDAIAAHPIKSHTILIDDLRCWRRDDATIGFGVDEIVRKVRGVNPAYRITYEDSPICPSDILVAQV